MEALRQSSSETEMESTKIILPLSFNYQNDHKIIISVNISQNQSTLRENPEATKKNPKINQFPPNTHEKQYLKPFLNCC